MSTPLYSTTKPATRSQNTTRYVPKATKDSKLPTKAPTDTNQPRETRGPGLVDLRSIPKTREMQSYTLNRFFDSFDTKRASKPPLGLTVDQISDDLIAMGLAQPFSPSPSVAVPQSGQVASDAAKCPHPPASKPPSAAKPAPRRKRKARALPPQSDPSLAPPSPKRQKGAAGSQRAPERGAAGPA